MNFRDIEMFRPYDDEFPEALLVDAGADDGCIERWQAAEMVRIAKIGERLVACYAMDRGRDLEFILHGIVTEPALRGQGLGRWVVGHAIGVAESKGARRLRLAQSGGSRCFARMGFVPDDHGLRFDLIPE